MEKITSSTPLLRPRTNYQEEWEDGEEFESHGTTINSNQLTQSWFRHHPSIQYSPSQVIEEVKQLISIALPMIITSLLIYSKMAISMYFLGRIGRDTLAGGCLAISAANITGYSVISGLSTGMEAISSQAYGAKQWKLMSLTLQRTILILLLACIPISLFWLNFEPFLKICGQNPKISSIATTYLVYSVPSIFIQSFINPLKIFLRTQKITNPLMLSSAFSLLLHFPVNYLIVHNFPKLGIRGIALACSLTDMNFLIALLSSIKYSSSCSASWTGFSVESFMQWKPILKQAIPSCFSVCLEWWWYEILIVLSGLLCNAAESVASSGIIIQCTALIYNFPYALNMAVSTRVGNELGANRPKNAKASSIIALFVAIFTGIIAMVFTISMRTTWGRIFTEDQNVISMLASALTVVGICEIGNCPQTTLCGVMRGSARPTLGAEINFLSFYLVGLPVSLFMGFTFDFGLVGLWIGLLAAQFVCAVTLVVMLVNTDWEAEAVRASELMIRANGSSEEINDGNNNNNNNDAIIRG